MGVLVVAGVIVGSVLGVNLISWALRILKEYK